MSIRHQPKNALDLSRDVLFLGVAERPDFIALDATAWQLFHVFVLVAGTRRSRVYEELCDRVDRDAHHASRRSEAVTFNKS